MKNSIFKLLFCFLLFSLKTFSAPIFFADANLKSYLLTSSSSSNIALNSVGNQVAIDVNADGEIDDVTEAPLVFQLAIVYSTVTNLSGIENFTNLTFLNCDHSPITSISIIAFPNLEYLRFAYTNVTTFNCYGHPSIKTITCYSSQLTSLNVANCNNLLTLDCSQNFLTSLDFNNCLLLNNANCSYNNLNNMDIGGVPSLVNFQAINNNMSNFLSFNVPSLNQLNLLNNNFTSVVSTLSNLPNLTYLVLDNNNLSSLDVSSLYNLTNLGCLNNPNLINLNIKNGRNEYVNFSSCPMLNLICIDEIQQATIDAAILANGYTTCNANSYCTAFPSGTYYTITGNNTLDIDMDGCTYTDPIVTNIKFEINDGISTRGFMTDASGYYNYFVSAGNYTLTPVLENPSYFNFSPTSGFSSFPSGINPSVQNFCFQPNGINNDLEIIIIPINDAIPGFIAKYKIIYKNKGNTVQNLGTISLNFNSLKLNFISSTPTEVSSTGSVINWGFTNLLPFETREILVEFQVHTPTETFPTSNGDLLSFSSSISTADIDVTPADNSFNYNQTVVGSFDPNDKTCLQGNIVGTEKIGEYVHYLIRFENTGTFNAQNIVVKDIIDTTKFDINTLVPLKGSHSFETKISSSNVVEFMFKNINLPFDDSNNDGFVAFKIKTLPSLVVGDTFSNKASIYFDFNFPIITNNETTTIQVLNKKDFNNSNIGIYPNPVNDILTINSKGIIFSVEVIDINGRIISSTLQNKKEVLLNIENLQSGIYVLKISTETGISIEKIMKN